MGSILFNLIFFLAMFGVFSAHAQTAGETFQDCDDCPQMVVVPSGKAILGTDPWIANFKSGGNIGGDGPVREVEIAYKLAVAKTEVTRAQYRAFVEATGHETIYEEPRVGCNSWNRLGRFGFVLEHTWDSPGYYQREDHPVICVSWTDGTDYAAWLAKTTGKPYRLLSSTEYEYASRAGTRGPWYWGPRSKDACKHANVADSTFRLLNHFAPVFYCDDGFERTAPVGSFEPNPWGLFDMFGNAWEWTDDCLHRDMSKIPTDGRAWLAEDDGNCIGRVPRGGSWASGTDSVRATAQAGDWELYHSQLLGFRVALTVE